MTRRRLKFPKLPKSEGLEHGPPTLTGRLPGGGQLAPTTNLVYAGDGRYYDPALGLYLQPDPFGGASGAPPSRNRYAVTQVSTFPTVGSVPGGGQDFGVLFHTLTLNSGKAASSLTLTHILAPLPKRVARKTQWTPQVDEIVWIEVETAPP
jgi:RHS repeat-associated protein